MSNLIFDFDGTLADTFPLVVDITYDITHARRLHPSRIEELRRVPLLRAVRSLGGKVWDIPFLLVLTRRAMRARINEVHTFPGMVKAVQQLHAAGHRLYVLTSNREDNVRGFLAHHHLSEYFEDVRHCNVFRKSAGLENLRRAHNLAGGQTFYIGNEAADIDGVRGSDIRAIAVTWSGQDHDLLDAAQPYKIVHTPAELVELMTREG